jgi:molecular chaperone GrpE
MAESGSKDKGKEDIKEDIEKAETPGDEIEIEAEAEAEEEDLDPIEKLEQKLAEARDEYLRLAAEFDNYRKRQTRNLEAVIKSANEGLIINFLEVLDNFERALDAGKEKPNFKKYHKGMKLIFEQLTETLERAGVQRFDSLGEKFDPNLHEALLTLESDDYEPDQVAQEISAGYKLHDKVIRHARVGVVSAKAEKKED